MTAGNPTTGPESTANTQVTAPNSDLDVSEMSSVGELFRARAAATPNGEALRFRGADGNWTSLTWAQTKDRAYDWAAGLIALGVEPQDRVAIASATRVEWALADLAAMCAGAATTTVYPTTIAGDVAYILTDSGSRVVIAEDDEQIEKLRAHRDELGDVIKVVTFAGTPDGDWVIDTDELARLGRELLADKPDAVDARIDALRPSELATIIYTSGTTGKPKGVRLSHSAWIFTGAATQANGLLTTDDLQFLWLPLAHVFGKVLLTIPLVIGFPTAIDGQIDKIVDNVGEVKPTFMGAAPRIFEKAYARINQMLQSEGGVKGKIAHWALGVAQESIPARERGEQPSGLKFKIADKLVMGKVRDRFGGRVRFFISGSAPLNLDVAKWFGSMGLLILEGYGLTETSAAATLNEPDAFKYGSVGKPIAGSEVKIAEDGEILIRGGQVMQGYHHRDDATAEVLTADGWFHTGDIGHLDDDGFLFITDRKKDLFKTSGGKYVAPSQIESRFKGICPFVSQFVVHGASRNYATALVTLDEEAITGWATQNGLGGKSYAEITQAPQTREMVQGYIDKLNSELNRWETIKKFEILDHDLTVENGDLTPSLKLKRKVVMDKYKDDLDSMYQ
ncbi:AMP-dependent synthetase/ligase [Epidermidibacterium keratini]|nr:long-chain fatty acid--CoA ligase [Epidermidibacterium keratini]